MLKAKALFETIGELNSFASSQNHTISLHDNFYEIGGNSLNSIFAIAKLRDKNYSIDISNFITAKNLSEILLKMVPLENNDGLLSFGEIGEQAELL